MRKTDLYERDFHAWANEQAALLRSGRVAKADLANLAEAIESMDEGFWPEQPVSRQAVKD